MQYLEVVVNRPLATRFTYRYQGDESLIGCRVKVVFSGREMNAIVINSQESSSYDVSKVLDIKKVQDEIPLLNAHQIALGQWMAKYYFCQEGEALFGMIPSAKEERKSDPTWALNPSQIETFLKPQKWELTPPQQKVLTQMLTDSSRWYYLYGVTGSGKTTVYLEFIRHLLKEKKSVIYLVPEITLCYQLIQQIRDHFSDLGEDSSLSLAVLHSGLSPSQRLKEWRRIQQEESIFVIGARSAVFAPVNNLGAIIIDEEHETSYKSGNTPRYHARQVAMQRLQKESKSENEGYLLLGSATPSVEAYLFMNQGTLTRLNLRERVGEGRIPRSTIVSMQGEKRSLSPLLQERLLAVTKEKKQALLFLNRRGYSYYYHCESCGYEMLCHQCSIALTYHKRENKMLCHYCGYAAVPVEVCPECHSYAMRYSGVGIEQVEEEVKRVIPEDQVRRLDTDTAKDKKYLKETLESFRTGKISVLLGTQMIAKGLNFPQVKLVGLILADSALNLPDFRAAERAFSLIQQVSGRAGRYRDDGEVIVQTFNPESSTIQRAVEYKNDDFYAEEAILRQQLDYPPFVRLFRLVLRGKSESKVVEEIEKVTQILTGLNETPLGPVQCPFSKISGNFRYHLLLKSKNFNQTHARIGTLFKEYRAPQGYYLEIDVDPLSIL